MTLMVTIHETNNSLFRFYVEQCRPLLAQITETGQTKLVLTTAIQWWVLYSTIDHYTSY